MIDVGVGYQFNTWFRVDGTLEYRAGANLQTLYALTDTASPPMARRPNIADLDRANVASFVGLVDAYVNSGPIGGSRPLSAPARLRRQQRQGHHRSGLRLRELRLVRARRAAISTTPRKPVSPGR